MDEVAAPAGSREGSGRQRGAERVFLITDVRGYSRFTREHGDEAAARLAGRFAELAREAVEARSGRVVELRGDEVFAIFDSAAQAVRAATELAAVCADEAASGDGLPLLAGVGIDVGEGVPVEDGFRGEALNMAARLCSQAAAGQVLVTTRLAEDAGDVPGVQFRPAGSAELKGYDAPVELVEAVPEARERPPAAAAPPTPVPLELEPDGPIVGRERELAWLRGTWRQVERGRGRVLVVSGPAGIGKTRLAAELAGFVHAGGPLVSYAGAGGTAAADATSALRGAVIDPHPSLLVLDDLDATADIALPGVEELREEIESGPALVLCLLRAPEAGPSLERFIGTVDRAGDGHRRLGPLGPDGVRAIAASYAPDDVEHVPLEAMARASGGVPARVHELMSEWAQEEATRRLAAAAEFLAAERVHRHADLAFANNVIGLKLGRLYAAEPAGLELEIGEAPYKGLASFEPEDAALFFGREHLVGELAARTVGAGLLGVVGASGSGKSSLIAAGLIPSLRAGLLPGSERWRSVIVRPGEHPLAELPALDGEERLVLAVDQFEELFTLCADEDERSAFVEQLVRVAAQPERAVVVIGLRGDYYGHCGAYPELAQLLAANQVIVGPMAGDELRRAIELPARRAGVRVESALTDALVDEIGDERGGLPLLSTALVELWGEREDEWLRLATYERLGGVRGAVARLAESCYENLTDEQRDAVRRLFLRLVAIGDEGAIAKRRVPLTELDLARDHALAGVVDRLTADRLLTAHESSVEVAHEALLREWPRFQEWLAEDAQGRELREHLTQSAKRWEAAGKDTAELYRGARLGAALDWAAPREHELNELERDYLAAGRTHGELEAERQRRQNRRLRGALVIAALLLAAAIVGGVIALQQSDSAQHQATVALGRQLGAEAVSEPRLDRAMLLARESLNLDRSTQTEGTLLATLLRSPSAIGTFTVPITVRPLLLALSPDGRTLAVSDNSGEVLLFDAATHVQVGKLSGVGQAGQPFAYSPDGRYAVTFSDDKPALALIDVHSRHIVRLLPMDRTFVNSLTSDSDPIVVGSRAAFMTYALVDRQTRAEKQAFVDRWDLRTGKLTFRPLRGASGMLATRLVDGGKELLTLTNDAAVTWDAKTFRRISTVPYHLPPGGEPGGAISPDGTEGAVPAQSGLDFVDLRTGVVTIGQAPNASIITVAFSPDSRTLVSVGDDRQVRVWTTGANQPTETFGGHGGRVTGLTFGTAAHTFYTSSLDGAIFAWDLGGSRGFGRTRLFARTSPNAVGSSTPPPLAVEGGRGVFATSPAPSATVDLLSTATLRLVASLVVSRDPTASVGAVAASPDGKEVAVGWSIPSPKLNTPGRGSVEIWSTSGAPRLVRTFPGVDVTVQNVAWAPDGKTVAAITGDGLGSSSTGSLFRWDAASGSLLWKRRRPDAGQSLAFSPDSRTIASTWSDRTLLVDAGTGRTIRTIRALGGDLALAFANVETLATGSYAGIVQLWNTSTGKEIGAPTQVTPAPVASLSFSPDGQTFVTAGGSDGVPKLWSTRTLQQLGSDFPGDPGLWMSARFTPDGRDIVVVGRSNRVWVWPATVSAWEQHACAVAGRNFTAEEWRRFVGGRSYSKVCA